jgi:hypothetical protein
VWMLGDERWQAALHRADGGTQSMVSRAGTGDARFDVQAGTTL